MQVQHSVSQPRASAPHHHPVLGQNSWSLLPPLTGWADLGPLGRHDHREAAPYSLRRQWAGKASLPVLQLGFEGGLGPSSPCSP